MIKKTISIIIFFICFSVCINAQTEKTGTNILERIQKKIESYKTFTVIADINGEKTELTVKDNCFKLSNSQLTVWYNGKNQWTFIKESNEVNITSPDKSEIGSINPYSFLKDWEKTCTCKYNGQKKINGKTCSSIELKANNPTGFENILIFANQSDEIEKMIIKDTNGYEFVIGIKEIKKNRNLDNNFFNFSKGYCPGAEIIDLR